MLLVNPGVAVSTAAVFGRWDGQDRGPLGEASGRRASPVRSSSVAWYSAPDPARMRETMLRHGLVPAPAA